MAKYDATFWRRILARTKPVNLLGTLKRIVENQEQKVTVKLVDSLEEHEVLESLLETSKPKVFAGEQLRRFDYLLQAPWRYPPLPWGSRFGRRFEPSLFYGAQTDYGLLAEAAYYRFVFIDGMQTPFAERVISQHTVFEARYQTSEGYDLRQLPFTKHAAALGHKSDYGPCQQLGSILREREIEAIQYVSARAPGRESCLALFSPRALRSRNHLNPRRGLCETSADQVTFSLGEQLHCFPRTEFLEEGRLPSPA